MASLEGLQVHCNQAAAGVEGRQADAAAPAASAAAGGEAGTEV